MELSITEFVVGVLLGSASLVLGCTLFSRWRHARAERRGAARRVICRLCLHPFEDFSRETIVTCPVCHAKTTKGSRPGP